MPNNPKAKANLKHFKKNDPTTGEKDPRINRLGRRLSTMSQLQREFQEVWSEILFDDRGKPIMDETTKAALTRLRARMRIATSSRNAQEFRTALEFSWGKPKEILDVNNRGEIILRVVREEQKINDN